MADKISPEEKLFKVIREGKKDGAKPLFKPHSIKRFFAKLPLGKKMFTIKPKPSQAAISGGAGAFSIPLSKIKPKTVNTLFAVILVSLAVLVIYVAINERPRIATIAERISEVPADPEKTEVIETFKPMSSYLAQVEKREIFQPISAIKPQAKILELQELAIDKLKEIAADFKLQGISWGQNPKVMIKNEKEDRMYFLGEGQTIGLTGVKMKAIYKNKIVISYEDAEMELL